jgi:hypothetical protein
LTVTLLNQREKQSALRSSSLAQAFAVNGSRSAPLVFFKNPSPPKYCLQHYVTMPSESSAGHYGRLPHRQMRIIHMGASSP